VTSTRVVVLNRHHILHVEAADDVDAGRLVGFVSGSSVAEWSSPRCSSASSAPTPGSWPSSAGALQVVLVGASGSGCWVSVSVVIRRVEVEGNVTDSGGHGTIAAEDASRGTVDNSLLCQRMSLRGPARLICAGR
jgi:hypothetical protein